MTYCRHLFLSTAMFVFAGTLSAIAVPEKAQVESHNPFAAQSKQEPAGTQVVVPNTSNNNTSNAVGGEKVKEEKKENPNEISLQPLAYPKTFPELMVDSKLAKLRRKYCRKYRGKYIGHYSEIYLVKNCERRLLEGPKSHFKLTQRGTKVHSVDPKVVAAIPLGKAMESIVNREFKGCRHYERKYVTYRDVDVYYVKNCKKLLLPNWDSYVIHRKKYGKGIRSVIYQLSWEEFIGLEEGDIIDSKVIAKLETKKIETSIEPFVDVIPISKACRGLNRKFVSYYSKVYKIQNCKKREIDSAVFSQKYRTVRPIELSSDQWISLPNGKDLKL